MYTIETFKTEFDFNEGKHGNSNFYHNMKPVEGHGDFCDVYIGSNENGDVLQSQVDAYNHFLKKHNSYLNELMDIFLPCFSSSDQEKILNGENTIYFDVIDIPYGNDEFDLLACSRMSVKKILWSKKEVNMDVKFKNGKIISTERKRYYAITR